ncbi:hypothetical protein ACQE3D_11800 [Methylomonas sp. MS20]|uniref:hypothetical protein n=1 Tax=unclassified Methylomonas TaxID=2608980 RepID=UPI0028A33387|nr:hypothetical protein [Methylomonas sp. MV1]MDT4328320.1 hypothetical protein [Methylomonas sp. MV1]
MNCYELLEEVKEAKKLKSDNELANFLGITRQSINGIKKGGGFNDEIAIKVAEITKRELAEILLIREIQSEQNEKIKSAWSALARRLNVAAGVVLAISLAWTGGDFWRVKLDKNLQEYTLCEVSVLGGGRPRGRWFGSGFAAAPSMRNAGRRVAVRIETAVLHERTALVRADEVRRGLLRVATTALGLAAIDDATG